MRPLLLAAGLMLCGAFSASATIVSFGSTSLGRSAFDSSLNVLADGDGYLVGTFSNVNGISLSSGSIANILANGGWSQFATAQSITSIFGHGGKLTNSVTDTSPAADAFNGLNAYIVIFNTSSAATATQIGIFRASAPTTDPWVFPVNGSTANNIGLNMDDDSIVAIGGVGSVTVSPLQQRFILSNVVPEPASAGLLAFGIFGLVGYRRMRRLG